MPLDDLLELTEVTPDGAKLMKITAGCPCDACLMARVCRVECGTSAGG